jgi:hypothetical protein
MLAGQIAEPEGATLTVHVPVAFRRRRGRKVLVTPDRGMLAPASMSRILPHSAMIRALARAFRWRRLIESGVHATVLEVAAAEQINPSYISRILRLSTLSPEVVEATVENPSSFPLDRVMKPFPVEWAAQTRQLSMSAIRL